MGAVGNRHGRKAVHGGLNGRAHGAGKEYVLPGVGAEIDARDHKIRLEVGHDAAQGEDHAVGRGAGNGDAFKGAAFGMGKAHLPGEDGAVHREAAARAGMLLRRGHGPHVVSCADKGRVEHVKVRAVYAVVVADEYAHGNSLRRERL